MIHLIVGPSCAGKTSFVVNQFIHGQEMSESRDLITYTECDDCYLIGKYIVSGSRTKGTDRVSRKDIPKIAEQVFRLAKKGKDVVLEGDKICSRNLFEQLRDSPYECQLWWVRCSKETSIKRNRKNDSTCSDSYLKTVASKAENIFWEYSTVFNGGIIDTDNVTDFSKVDLKNIPPIYPCKETEDVREDFAIIILTHGRANNQKTEKQLEKAGYTGKVYYLIDDLDEQGEEYKEKYGERVFVFNKENIMEKTDIFWNEKKPDAVVYAKNACFDIARNAGLNYFAMADDDLTRFLFKRINEKGKLETKPATRINGVINAVCEYLENDSIQCLGFAKEGAFIGGVNRDVEKGTYWRLGQFLFCSVDKPWQFRGLYYEDSTASLDIPESGRTSFSLMAVGYDTEHDKNIDGGMAESYQVENVDYIGNSMIHMANPGKVTINLKDSADGLQWRFTVEHDKIAPKIIRQQYRKEVT